MRSVAQITAFNSQAALLFNDAVAAKETLKALNAGASIIAAFLFDKQGSVVDTYTEKHYEPIKLERFSSELTKEFSFFNH